MKQFQGSLGPFPDFVKKGRPDARSAPSQLDPWMDSNVHAIEEEPASLRQWGRKNWRYCVALQEAVRVGDKIAAKRLTARLARLLDAPTTQERLH